MVYTKYTTSKGYVHHCFVQGWPEVAADYGLSIGDVLELERGQSVTVALTREGNVAGDGPGPREVRLRVMEKGG